MIITIPHWLNLEAISMMLSAHYLQQLQSAVMLAMTKMLMMMKTHSTLGREKTKKLVSK